MVVLHTNFGDIKLELDAEKAPKTVANFLEYVKNGHFDGTIFHRVIDGFMIQGGGFEPGMVQKDTQAPIENEADNGLKNAIGTIAMARTMDPHSASSQFFINVSRTTLSLTIPPRLPMAGATAYLARSLKGWTLSTRSRQRKPPSVPVTRMFPLMM